MDGRKTLDRNRWLHGEPRLDDALNDPVVQRIMRRDGVTAADVRAVVAPVIARLRLATPEARDAA